MALNKSICAVPPPSMGNISDVSFFLDSWDSCGGSATRRMRMYVVAMQGRTPEKKYREHRRNGAWEEHVAKCLHKRNEFQMRYHMSKQAFDKLVELLNLPVDQKQSRCSSSAIEPIDANIIVACGLQFLGGDTHKTNADAFHLSIPSSKRVIR
jgi:hypothetical protein